MRGNGFRIGTTRSITPTVLPPIQKDQLLGSTACCEVAHHSAIRNLAVHRRGISSELLQLPTITAFAWSGKQHQPRTDERSSPLNRFVNSGKGRVWSFVAMTEAEFAATPTRTVLVGSAFFIVGQGHRHDVRWRPPLLKQTTHRLHGGSC